MTTAPTTDRRVSREQQAFNERADLALISFLGGAATGALVILILSIIWDARLAA